MIQAVLTYGSLLTLALLLVSLLLVKVTPKESYLAYVPGFIFFAVGLVCLLFATLFDRIWILEAGLGGWGIASLFAATISMIISAVVDAYRQEEA